MNSFIIQKIAYKFYSLHIPFIPKLLQIFIFLIYNSYIPYELEIGRGSKAGHRGIGLVINKNCKIGTNCLIRAHVTIGGEHGGFPVIGNHVQIGDGAKILGNIKIGDYSKIGANAVVLQDVPPYATAVGVPARIIKKIDN